VPHIFALAEVASPSAAWGSLRCRNLAFPAIREGVTPAHVQAVIARCQECKVLVWAKQLEMWVLVRERSGCM
jgi:hypothetical protein